MRKITTSFFAFAALVSCKEIKETKESGENSSSTTTQQVAPENRPSEFCETADFDSPAARVEVLLAHFERLETADGEARKTAEKAFFCAFPDSFEAMQQLFGYEDGTEAPLYDRQATKESYKNNHISNDLIGYFSELQSVPVDLYYKKYINICINGKWEADNITQGFGLWNRMLTDSKASCQVLKTYSEAEIKSVFRFFFDGPHPKNDYNANLYEKLLSEIKKNNPGLSTLLQDAYTELIDNTETETSEKTTDPIEIDYPYTILDDWLQLGLSEKTISTKLGIPEEKGEEQNWEATGDFVQEWKYPLKGITLQMSSEVAGQPKKVLMIISTAPCTMKTDKSIGLGTPRQQVIETHAGQITPNYDYGDGPSDKTIVVGSIYGGVIFTMENDTVSQIFIGAAAE